jgi:hypothetical protein
MVIGAATLLPGCRALRPAQLCNHSAQNYTILSVQPPLAWNAGTCIEAAWIAAPAAATTLTIAGDDDPVDFSLKPLSRPGETLQLNADGRLYLESPRAAGISLADAPQPPGYPLEPIPQ